MGNNWIHNTFAKPLKNAARAAKVNLVPGLILQSFALIIVLLYYFYSPSRPIFEKISEYKIKYGYFFSMVSTSFFGAVLPFLFLLIQKSTRKLAIPGSLPFLLLFWGFKGVEIDVLYRIQAFFFGTELKWSVVFPKILVDQFVYVTIWGGPTMVLFLYWNDCGYSFAKVKKVLNKRFYPDHIFPVVVSNWAVWLPAVTLVYCLPLALQVPIENIILCFWVLMLTIITPKPV